MEGVTYDGVTYDSRIKKWKVCRVAFGYPVEELVTGLSLYDAVVEKRWREKYPPYEGVWRNKFGIFPQRAKIHKEYS